MIVLARTREEMLAEIKASESAFANRVEDSFDPEFLVRDETSVVVRGAWEEIMPQLRAPLARRFADLSPEQFIRDIDRPLKMGLGNAHKRGNLGDRTKQITVEAVVTDTGAMISVSDEGSGFDVESTLNRCRTAEKYYTHKGGGFKAFERASSLVSFADGGSTLLIRFLCASIQSWQELTFSEDFMKSVLRKLPMIRKCGDTLGSCRVSELLEHRPGQPEVRCVLEIRKAASEPQAMVLIGRLLSESAAHREHSVAKQLYKAGFKGGDGLRVPKPMEVFKRHPRLVLYRFDPRLTFRRYLSVLPGPDAVAAIRKVAVGLRSLHRSGISVDIWEDSRGARERLGRSGEGIVRALDGSPPGVVDRAKRFFSGLERLSADLDGFSERVPIHGSFGWDCVRPAVDRLGADQLYVYRFDECRLSHPGFDIGEFLADLTGSAVTGALGPSAPEAFLDGYLRGDNPSWLDALPFFTACANLRRFERVIQRSRRVDCEGIEAFLSRCEASLLPAKTA